MKSGFIAITGRPNAGKSTLLNRIIGEKIAIVSGKPQTTRNKILGVYTKENCQMVLLDTPGIHKARNKLGQRMVKDISNAVQDIDVLLYVVDCGLDAEEYETERRALDGLNISAVPVVLVVNKTDVLQKAQLLPVLDKLNELRDFSSVVPVSAMTGENLPELLREIERLLPEGPQYFEDGVVTDQPEKQIAAEFIREKALRLLNQEVPHGIAVEIEKMTHREQGGYEIMAAIYCEKQSHKGIIIGKGGEKLKEIGSQARQDIERLLGEKVYLKLWVRVKEDWRNRESFLNSTLRYD